VGFGAGNLLGALCRLSDPFSLFSLQTMSNGAGRICLPSASFPQRCHHIWCQTISLIWTWASDHLIYFCAVLMIGFLLVLLRPARQPWLMPALVAPGLAVSLGFARAYHLRLPMVVRSFVRASLTVEWQYLRGSAGLGMNLLAPPLVGFQVVLVIVR
jgi:hypothetical protein